MVRNFRMVFLPSSYQEHYVNDTWCQIHWYTLFPKRNATFKNLRFFWGRVYVVNHRMTIFCIWTKLFLCSMFHVNQQKWKISQCRSMVHNIALHHWSAGQHTIQKPSPVQNIKNPIYRWLEVYLSHNWLQTNTWIGLFVQAKSRSNS